MNKAELAIHVKTMREKSGLSRSKLAMRMNLCTQSLAQYEKEKATPRNVANFLRKLEEDINYNEEQITPYRTGSREFSETIIVGEELEWQWYLEDVLEAQEMSNRGIPDEMIASNFGRLVIEISIMLDIRTYEGHIEPRTSGI